MGRASPIHQHAIRRAVAAVCLAPSDIPSGVGATRTRPNKKSPSQNGILELELFKLAATLRLGYFIPAKEAALDVSILTAGPIVDVRAMDLR